VQHVPISLLMHRARRAADRDRCVRRWGFDRVAHPLVRTRIRSRAGAVGPEQVAPNTATGQRCPGGR
jgi:hypothetical protein